MFPLCYYCDRVSVAVDIRTLLDRNNFSSSSNGQVAAHRVTVIITKRLWLDSIAVQNALHGTSSELAAI